MDSKQRLCRRGPRFSHASHSEREPRAGTSQIKTPGVRRPSFYLGSTAGITTAIVRIFSTVANGGGKIGLGIGIVNADFVSPNGHFHIIGSGFTSTVCGRKAIVQRVGQCEKGAEACRLACPQCRAVRGFLRGMIGRIKSPPELSTHIFHSQELKGEGGARRTANDVGRQVWKKPVHPASCTRTKATLSQRAGRNVGTESLKHLSRNRGDRGLNGKSESAFRIWLRIRRQSPTLAARVATTTCRPYSPGAKTVRALRSASEA